MADVTNKTDSDVVWTNQAKFNTITMNLEASINIDYTFAHVPPRPRYIRDHKFGIVDAYIDVNHFKLSKGKTNIDKSHSMRERFDCVLSGFSLDLFRK